MKSERPVIVLLETRALRKACHIQPVPGPAFTVARGAEQFVDGGIGILNARLKLHGSRRDSGEIKIQPAHQSGRVSRRIVS